MDNSHENNTEPRLSLQTREYNLPGKDFGDYPSLTLIGVTDFSPKESETSQTQPSMIDPTHVTSGSLTTKADLLAVLYMNTGPDAINLGIMKIPQA